MNAEPNLSLFLRNLADKVDANTLTSHQLQKLGEFFVEYSVMEQNNELSSPSRLLKKYLFLGTYIYKFLLTETDDGHNLGSDDMHN